MNDFDRHIEKNDMISGPLKDLPENCLFRKDHIIYCMKMDERMIDNWLHTVVVIHANLAPFNLKRVIALWYLTVPYTSRYSPASRIVQTLPIPEQCRCCGTSISVNRVVNVREFKNNDFFAISTAFTCVQLCTYNLLLANLVVPTSSPRSSFCATSHLQQQYKQYHRYVLFLSFCEGQ